MTDLPGGKPFLPSQSRCSFIVGHEAIEQRLLLTLADLLVDRIERLLQPVVLSLCYARPALHNLPQIGRLACCRKRRIAILTEKLLQKFLVVFERAEPFRCLRRCEPLVVVLECQGRRPRAWRRIGTLRRVIE
jgi:hypothetical protein